MKRSTSAYDAAERKGCLDLLLQIGVMRLELLPELLQFRKSTSISDRRRGLIREHPQPTGLLLVDGLAAKNRQDTQCFVSKNQWLPGKTRDTFALHPLWTFPPLGIGIHDQNTSPL